MRFRARFGLLGWVFVVNTVIFDTLWLLRLERSTVASVDAILMPAVLLVFLGRALLVYWDLQNDGIVEHRYGSRRKIAYSEITQVRVRASRSKTPRGVVITYVPAAEPRKRKRLNLDPSNIQDLLEALRHHDPAGVIDA